MFLVWCFYGHIHYLIVINKSLVIVDNNSIVVVYDNTVMANSGVETGHIVWSLWDAHNHTSCHLCQHSSESWLANRKNAWKRLHSIFNGKSALLEEGDRFEWCGGVQYTPSGLVEVQGITWRASTCTMVYRGWMIACSLKVTECACMFGQSYWIPSN